MALIGRDAEKQRRGKIPTAESDDKAGMCSHEWSGDAASTAETNVGAVVFGEVVDNGTAVGGIVSLVTRTKVVLVFVANVGGRLTSRAI